jgi:hypothetical protein
MVTAADRQGTSVIAIIGSSPVLTSEVLPRQLAAWNAHTGQVLRIDHVADRPNSTTFLNHQLTVGYANGKVRSFTLHGDTWQQQSETSLPGAVLALSGKSAPDALVALIGVDASKPPTIVLLDSRTLQPTTRHPMEGESGPADVAIMHDGQVVTAFSSGTVSFLDSTLNIEATTHVDLGLYVRGIYEAPSRDEVIVSGQQTSYVFNSRAYDVLTDSPFNERGRSLYADGTIDGRYFASTDVGGGRLVIWAENETDLRRSACAAIGRDLTREEWARVVGSDVPYRPVCGR